MVLLEVGVEWKTRVLIQDSCMNPDGKADSAEGEDRCR